MSPNNTRRLDRKQERALLEAGIPITAFFTNDIQGEFERLKELEVAFRSELTEMGPITAVLFEDTCGNLINVVQVQPA